MPFAGFTGALLAAGGGEGVVLGAPIVLGLAPFRRDETFLFELEEGGVQRAVVEREAVLARLLDPPGDAVAVQGSQDLEGLEDHQGERARLHIQLLGHCAVLWDTHSTVRPGVGFRQERGRGRGGSGAARSPPLEGQGGGWRRCVFVGPGMGAVKPSVSWVSSGSRRPPAISSPSAGS